MPTLFFALLLMILSLSTEATSAIFHRNQNSHQASLQRGAQFYMNYCLGCHSLRYLRYEQMARSLGLTSTDGEVEKALLENNLLFTEAKPYDPILSSMPAEDARKWFGMVPPDLSLITREKGSDWVLSYLKSFYPDSSRPFGSNNSLQSATAMPNVLAPLVRTLTPLNGSHSTYVHAGSSLLLVNQEESLSPLAYDIALQDLVSFLVYVAEPAREARLAIGPFVILFLLLFLVIAYQLKRNCKP